GRWTEDDEVVHRSIDVQPAHVIDVVEVTCRGTAIDLALRDVAEARGSPLPRHDLATAGHLAFAGCNLNRFAAAVAGSGRIVVITAVGRRPVPCAALVGRESTCCGVRAVSVYRDSLREPRRPSAARLIRIIKVEGNRPRRTKSATERRGIVECGRRS